MKYEYYAERIKHTEKSDVAGQQHILQQAADDSDIVYKDIVALNDLLDDVFYERNK